MNREQMLKEMGLGPIWTLRQPPKKKRGAMAEPEAALPVDARTAAIAAMGWDELKQAVADCTACELCKTRKQAVLGVGDINADWLFVGEGPGAEEDERGEPFVGQSGKLLDAMLAAIDLKRGHNVYIANSVKCRPPDNRAPEPSETAACWPFLARQVELLKPKLIVTLGRPAAQTLLQQEVKIAEARGKVQDFAGIPLIITYHPAYLLRNLPDKAKAWEDLCFMRRTMKERGSSPA
ncbi:MAG: uracil-DNA glycosylase [Rhodocyclaceae bacterium]|nr:uracil-DNA glycosylase [Rhodocyclaceae bacterium]MDZ4215695.1 uracil-DNA glycosylase [Rhodocyclaceae bacterium]